MRHALLSSLMILASLAPAAAQDSTDWALGLKQLYRLDRLPRLR